MGSQNFSYPIYKAYRADADRIVKFTGITRAEAWYNGSNEFGKDIEGWVPHTDESFWMDCESPEPEAGLGFR